MRKDILLQRQLTRTLSFMHSKRRNVLFGAVNALIEGARLTLSALGRHYRGVAKERNQIRKMDRLLGNSKLHKEIPRVYSALNNLIISNPFPIICIDWSCLNCAEDIYLLRASLKVKGRSFVCYQEVHPKSHENNTKAQNQFLDNLSKALPAEVKPIIVTDAIFSTLWFNKVLALGWDFVGRVRKNRGSYWHNGQWNPVSHAYDKATSDAKTLGQILLTRRNQLSCRMVIYKKKALGRKCKNGKGQIAKGSYQNVMKKSGKEPWIIVTSLSSKKVSDRIIIKYYSYRMQIEEDFRDTKSHKYGFGLSDSGTKIHARIAVLLIINLLACICCWVLACYVVAKKKHVDYHANSLKGTNVLSAIFLGRRVFNKTKAIPIKEFEKAFIYWKSVIKGQIEYGEIL